MADLLGDGPWWACGQSRLGPRRGRWPPLSTRAVDEVGPVRRLGEDSLRWRGALPRAGDGWCRPRPESPGARPTPRDHRRGDAIGTGVGAGIHDEVGRSSRRGVRACTRGLVGVLFVAGGFI